MSRQFRKTGNKYVDNIQINLSGYCIVFTQMMNRNHMINTLSYENYCLKEKVNELLEKISHLQTELLEYKSTTDNESMPEHGETDEKDVEIQKLKEIINQKEIENEYLKEIIEALSSNKTTAESDSDTEKIYPDHQFGHKPHRKPHPKPDHGSDHGSDHRPDHGSDHGPDHQVENQLAQILEQILEHPQSQPAHYYSAEAKSPAEIEALEVMLAEKQAEIDNLNTRIAEYETRMTELQDTITQKETTINGYLEQICEIDNLKTTLALRDVEKTQLRTILAGKDAEIAYLLTLKNNTE